jgi:BASS family bile acid:Na+ symporter
MNLKESVVHALRIERLRDGHQLRTGRGACRYLVSITRRPRLLLRSVLAVFVIMPIVAVVLVRYLDFEQTTEIVLGRLGDLADASAAASEAAQSPRRSAVRPGAHGGAGRGIHGGDSRHPGLNWLFSKQLVAPGSVVRTVRWTTLAPLAVGMVRAVRPAAATRLAKPVALASMILLSIGVLVRLAGTFHGWTRCSVPGPSQSWCYLQPSAWQSGMCSADPTRTTPSCGR